MLCTIDAEPFIASQETLGLTFQVPCAILPIIMQAFMMSPISTSWYEDVWVICLLQKRASIMAHEVLHQGWCKPFLLLCKLSQGSNILSDIENKHCHTVYKWQYYVRS